MSDENGWATVAKIAVEQIKILHNAFAPSGLGSP